MEKAKVTKMLSGVEQAGKGFWGVRFEYETESGSGRMEVIEKSKNVAMKYKPGYVFTKF